jgi:pimeloyl-ACP methyl ester carboxylesterase
MMRGIAALIKAVGAKNVYLMGQSYGRLIAQIIAKRHPEAVKGMILSGTCGLGKDIDAEGRAVIDKMLDPAKTAKSHETKTVLPFSEARSLMRTDNRKPSCYAAAITC